MIEIRLEGIHFHAPHGLHPEEKEKGNEFIIKVIMQTSQEVENDAISQTTDYEQVYQLIAEEMAGSVNLLETLCKRIGKRLIKELSHLEKLEVEVAKLRPPVGGIVERAVVKQAFIR